MKLQCNFHLITATIALLSDNCILLVIILFKS